MPITSCSEAAARRPGKAASVAEYKIANQPKSGLVDEWKLAEVGGMLAFDPFVEKHMAGKRGE